MNSRQWQRVLHSNSTALVQELPAFKTGQSNLLLASAGGSCMCGCLCGAVGVASASMAGLLVLPSSEPLIALRITQHCIPRGPMAHCTAAGWGLGCALCPGPASSASPPTSSACPLACWSYCASRLAASEPDTYSPAYSATNVPCCMHCRVLTHQPCNDGKHQTWAVRPCWLQLLAVRG